MHQEAHATSDNDRPNSQDDLPLGIHCIALFGQQTILHLLALFQDFITECTHENIRTVINKKLYQPMLFDQNITNFQHKLETVSNFNQMFTICGGFCAYPSLPIQAKFGKR